MNTQEFIDIEQLRLEAYRLLADGYHRPDPSLPDSMTKLKILLEPVCREAVAFADGMLADIASTGDTGSLEVDYTRLFVGPFNVPAPPYGSVYLEGERQVMGASTADVRKRYLTAGLDLDAGFKDAPDHIAAELEFMHFLIFKAMEAAGSGDFNQVITCLLDQKYFLEIHLGAWIHDFSESVVENANTSFYRNLARATKTFIKEDYRKLSSALTSWSYNSEETHEVASFSGQC